MLSVHFPQMVWLCQKIFLRNVFRYSFITLRFFGKILSAAWSHFHWDCFFEELVLGFDGPLCFSALKANILILKYLKKFLQFFAKIFTFFLEYTLWGWKQKLGVVSLLSIILWLDPTWNVINFFLIFFYSLSIRTVKQSVLVFLRFYFNWNWTLWV